MALEGVRVDLVRVLIEKRFATRPATCPKGRTLLGNPIDLKAMGTDDVLAHWDASCLLPPYVGWRRHLQPGLDPLLYELPSLVWAVAYAADDR
jgi:hypothetical protein